MEHFYQNIPGWFSFNDVYRDAVAAATHHAHFIEIGAAWGRSAAFMAVEIINSQKNIRFDVIDSWQGSGQHENDHHVSHLSLAEKFFLYTRPVEHIIKPVKSTSLSASRLYVDNSLDFVFIDASHEYLDVVNDIKAWLPKITPGGVLAGDDYNWVGVRQAVDEVLGKKNILFNKNTEWPSWIYKKS